MHNLNKAEINLNVVQWLNKKTESSNHRVVLLEGFTYMLIKLKHQKTVRLHNGFFHQRFWKSLDRTLNYNLYHKQKRKHQLELYRFYYDVLISEQFINVENEKLATVTEKGFEFLKKPYHEQLDLLLSKIW